MNSPAFVCGHLMASSFELALTYEAAEYALAYQDLSGEDKAAQCAYYSLP